jgi:hypothetical protein
MNTPLPPPDPSTFQPQIVGRNRSHRGRTILAAVAGAAATVGLLGVVPNLVLANSSSTPSSTAAPPDTTPPDTTAPTEPAPTKCVGSVEITQDTAGKPIVSSDTSGDCEKVLGGIFPIDDKTLAAFDKCMSSILGELPAFDPNGTVTVDGSAGLSVYDFGDGDGKITITKSGEAISAETTGDVSAVDLGAIDDRLGEHSVELEACNELLPALPAIDMGDLPSIDIHWNDEPPADTTPPTTG